MRLAANSMKQRKEEKQETKKKRMKTMITNNPHLTRPSRYLQSKKRDFPDRLGPTTATEREKSSDRGLPVSPEVRGDEGTTLSPLFFIS